MGNAWYTGSLVINERFKYSIILYFIENTALYSISYTLEQDKMGQNKIIPIKTDKDKLRMDLIPAEVIEELAKILTYGAKKYNDRGWEKGTNWGRYFASLQRHLWAFWKGEDYDDKSKESHLTHALFQLSVLLTYFERHIGVDDRTN